MYSISASSLSVSQKEILQEMGYGSVLPEKRITGLTEQLLSEITEVTTARYMFRVFDGAIGSTTVRLDRKEIFEVGKTLAALLKGASRFALFAATAGEGFHNYQERLKAEGDILKMFIADTIGTCMVEKAGDYLEKSLKAYIGMEKHTNRFSPGYCGWHLSDQKKLFRLLGNRPCGIVLSDHCLMSPIKSISGIIGIGTEVCEKRYGCLYCEMETCYKRKRKINDDKDK